MAGYKYKYKCVGGKCPLKANCILFLIDRSMAEWIMRPPVIIKDGKPKCDDYLLSEPDKMIHDMIINPVPFPKQN